MVKIEERVIVHGHPLRELGIELGNVLLFRILVPLFKRPERPAVVNRVIKPQTEAGGRESQRPHFGVLSMRADGALAPLLADPLIQTSVRILEGVLAMVHNGKATIIFLVAGRIQV